MIIWGSAFPFRFATLGETNLPVDDAVVLEDSLSFRVSLGFVVSRALNDPSPAPLTQNASGVTHVHEIQRVI